MIINILLFQKKAGPDYFFIFFRCLIVNLILTTLFLFYVDATSVSYTHLEKTGRRSEEERRQRTPNEDHRDIDHRRRRTITEGIRGLSQRGKPSRRGK